MMWAIHFYLRNICDQIMGSSGTVCADNVPSSWSRVVVGKSDFHDKGLREPAVKSSLTLNVQTTSFETLKQGAGGCLQ